MRVRGLVVHSRQRRRLLRVNEDFSKLKFHRDFECDGVLSSSQVASREAQVSKRQETGSRGWIRLSLLRRINDTRRRIVPSSTVPLVYDVAVTPILCERFPAFDLTQTRLLLHGVSEWPTYCIRSWSRGIGTGNRLEYSLGDIVRDHDLPFRSRHDTVRSVFGRAGH